MAPLVGSRVAGVDLLNEEEITVGLVSLPAWARAGGSISRTVELADFREAMLFTGAVAYLAEKANHHPDILIEWNKVMLTLSTHSAGGLTAADLSLAGRIDELAPPLTAL
jgi:4a-hydroxytetrahydrobiopterin dehydratase